MAIPRIGPSQFARFWAPWVSDEDSRSESVIAIARVILSSSALLIVWFEPTDPAEHAGRVHALLVIYTVFAVFALLLLMCTCIATSRWARMVVLTCDLLFAILLTSLTRGPASPFFAFLMFGVLSAACRWGAQETLVTTAAVVCALGVEAVLVSTTTPWSIRVREGDLGLSRSLVRSVYVVIAGMLLAALAEKEKQRRREIATITSMVDQAGTAAGPDGTLEAVLGVMLRAFGSARAVLALKQTLTDRVFLWNAVAARDTSDAIVTSSELGDEQVAGYLFPLPGHVWHAARARTRTWFDLLSLDADGSRLPSAVVTLPPALFAGHRRDSVLGVSIAFGDEWSGRLLLVDPGIDSSRQAALRLALRLARQIGPAAHQGYVLGMLRARAAGMERARLARELHDGVVQSLVVAEIQLEVVRRRAATDSPQSAEALTHIQALLRDEIRNVRELTHRLKTTESHAAPLPGLTDLVARFERDTGIQARLVSDAGAAAIPARASDEVSHILQEGLVNVRKHSGARHVLVRAATAHGRLMLSIEDDGRGFPFSGRRSRAELAAVHQGPAVIMERVQALGGELSVESTPGHGARLDVAVPLLS
jgi:signal transduction histidine kinase